VRHESARSERRLSEAIDRLVRLYEDWGKDEEAAKWRSVRQKP
jgi:hypothetical protein